MGTSTPKTRALIISLAVLFIAAAVYVIVAVFFTKRSSVEVRNDVALIDFELPPAPELHEASYDDAPLYIYLFTHTEDPFNHELYEERYLRTGEIVREVAEQYPELGISWMIEFMGADAKTITDRNEQTGLVDYLLELQSEDVVEFGYHAHHDPTYDNRPQKSLSDTPTFEEAYEALWSWMTCVRNLTFGGCVEERGGGLEAILNTFGEVEIVTGVGYNTGLLLERAAGAIAIQELLPDRLLGFGFPDHGATIRDKDYRDAREDLMNLLVPTSDTNSGVIWLDGAIRINDDVSLEGWNIAPLIDGAEAVADSLAELDRSSPLLMNAGVASKYLYSASGNSPTKYGYLHPESPELPEEWLETSFEKEKNYRFQEQGLDYLASYLAENNGRFVNSDEAVELFTSDDFWHVEEDEVLNIALWLLHGWDDASPDWVYDGEDFYSLADAFALLASGLNDQYPTEGIVSRVFGPWSRTSKVSSATTVEVDEVIAWAQNLEYENRQIEETYKLKGESYTVTQLLYAMAYAFVYDFYGVDAEMIDIPKMDTAPPAYDILETLGCEDCFDTSWSLKPARFQD